MAFLPKSPSGMSPEQTGELLLKYLRQGIPSNDLDFENAELSRANLQQAKLGFARLRAANLEKAILYRANLESSDLQLANLFGANLVGAHMPMARLNLAHLGRANLQGANLFGADLQHACLKGAQLEGACLQEAKLQRANLSGVNLKSADLRRANLEHSELGGACVSSESLLAAEGIQDSHVSYATYCISQWTPSELASLVSRGVQITKPLDFPREIIQMLSGGLEGLTIYFDQKLSAFERFLIDATLSWQWGPECNCKVSEYLEPGNASVLRIVGPPMELETVGDTIWGHQWIRYSDASSSESVENSSRLSWKLDHLEQTLLQSLPEIRRKLNRIELHAPEPIGPFEINPSQQNSNHFDQSQDNCRRNNSRVLVLLRSWTPDPAASYSHSQLSRTKAITSSRSHTDLETTCLMLSGSYETSTNR